jgi:hypothetical protein
MAETPRAGGPKADGSAPKRRAQPRGTPPSDPRKHAAELLHQADRLTELARELRREARRLNASLGVPVPRSTGSDRRQRPRTKAQAPAGQSPPVRERRFAPTDGQRQPVPAGADRQPDELPISDGARLMITNMASAGSSREEILGLMRDELGLENAGAILDRLIR